MEYTTTSHSLRKVKLLQYNEVHVRRLACLFPEKKVLCATAYLSLVVFTSAWASLNNRNQISSLRNGIQQLVWGQPSPWVSVPCLHQQRCVWAGTSSPTQNRKYYLIHCRVADDLTAVTSRYAYYDQLMTVIWNYLIWFWYAIILLSLVGWWWVTSCISEAAAPGNNHGHPVHCHMFIISLYYSENEGVVTFSREQSYHIYL